MDKLRGDPESACKDMPMQRPPLSQAAGIRPSFAYRDTLGGICTPCSGISPGSSGFTVLFTWISECESGAHINRRLNHSILPGSICTIHRCRDFVSWAHKKERRLNTAAHHSRISGLSLRFLYSPGVIPYICLKRRIKLETFTYPTRFAISFRGTSIVSRYSQARFIRRFV